MKFTPAQVIEMANDCGLVGYGEDAGEYRIPAAAFRARMERLCTLAAERALEAAAVACQAEKTTGPSNEASFYNGACVDCAYAIRAMKEQQ